MSNNRADTKKETDNQTVELYTSPLSTDSAGVHVCVCVLWLLMVVHPMPVRWNLVSQTFATFVARFLLAVFACSLVRSLSAKNTKPATARFVYLRDTHRYRYHHHHHCRQPGAECCLQLYR